MDNFQSSSFKSCVCVCVLFLSPIELLLSEWMSVCMFLLSRIIDFWYLAFASLHLNQTIQYAVACFFINRKLIFKCTETGTGNSSRSIGREKNRLRRKKSKWNSGAGCLFKLTHFSFSIHMQIWSDNILLLKYCCSRSFAMRNNMPRE